MASVYILHSKELNRFYIGSCKDLSYRIGQHINKDYVNSFTTKAEDWQLFFFEDELSYSQARAIEHHIKKMKSVVYINNLSTYPEMMEKLKEKYK